MNEKRDSYQSREVFLAILNNRLDFELSRSEIHFEWKTKNMASLLPNLPRELRNIFKKILSLFNSVSGQSITSVDLTWEDLPPLMCEKKLTCPKSEIHGRLLKVIDKFLWKMPIISEDSKFSLLQPS